MKELIAIIFIILLVMAIYIFIAIPNYTECRQKGFGIRFCASNNLLR